MTPDSYDASVYTRAVSIRHPGVESARPESNRTRERFIRALPYIAEVDDGEMKSAELQGAISTLRQAVIGAVGVNAIMSESTNKLQGEHADLVVWIVRLAGVDRQKRIELSDALDDLTASLPKMIRRKLTHSIR
jgi:hypothetical protein